MVVFVITFRCAQTTVLRLPSKHTEISIILLCLFGILDVEKYCLLRDMAVKFCIRRKLMKITDLPLCFRKLYGEITDICIAFIAYVSHVQLVLQFPHVGETQLKTTDIRMVLFVLLSIEVMTTSRLLSITIQRTIDTSRNKYKHT